MFNDNNLIDIISENQGLLEKIINKLKEIVKYITSNKEQKRIIDLTKKLEKKFVESFKKVETDNKKDIKFHLSKNALSDVSKLAKETREQTINNKTQFIKLKDNTISELVNYGVKICQCWQGEGMPEKIF